MDAILLGGDVKMASQRGDIAQIDHSHSVKVTASKFSTSLNGNATGVRSPLSAFWGASPHLRGRPPHLSCVNWGFFSAASRQLGRSAIGYEWPATWRRAALPVTGAAS